MDCHLILGVFIMAEAAQREWNEKQWLHYLYGDVLLAGSNLQLFSYTPSPDLRVSVPAKADLSFHEIFIRDGSRLLSRPDKNLIHSHEL